MSNQNLKELWNTNKLDELGDKLFTCLSQDQQVNWLYNLLFLSINFERKDTPASVKYLLSIINESDKWVECKDLFSDLRSETLKYEKSNSKDHYLIGICYLSESIAKILYNYAKPDVGGFDINEHQYIPSCVKYLVDHSDDEVHRERIVEFIVREPSRI